jgi:hypothetical protein
MAVTGIFQLQWLFDCRCSVLGVLELGDGKCPNKEKKKERKG